MLMRRIKLAYLRLFSRPSRARVNKTIRADNKLAIQSNKYFEGESGHGRFN